MKLRANAYFLLILVAILLPMIIMAVRIPYTSARLLPLLIGGIVLVLAVIELIREVTIKKQPESKAGESTPAEAVAGAMPLKRGYFVAGAWLASFLAVIYLAGFTFAAGAFVLAYMKTHKSGWVQSIIYAVVAAAFFYGVFQYFMGVDLYPGLVADLLGLTEF